MSHTRMTTFLLLEVSPLHVFEFDFLSLLCNTNTLRNILMMIGTNVEQDEMTLLSRMTTGGIGGHLSVFWGFFCCCFFFVFVVCFFLFVFFVVVVVVVVSQKPILVVLVMSFNSYAIWPCFKKVQLWPCPYPPRGKNRPGEYMFYPPWHSIDMLHDHMWKKKKKV